MEENDHSLLEVITKNYYKTVLFHCYELLNQNQQDAEDAAQKVFLLLFQKWKQVSLKKDIRKWLYWTAENVSKEILRKNAARIGTVSLDYQKEQLSTGETLIDGSLHELFSLLDPEEQRLVTSYYITGLSIKEMARQEGCSENALYIRLYKLKKKFYDLYNN